MVGEWLHRWKMGRKMGGWKVGGWMDGWWLVVWMADRWMGGCMVGAWMNAKYVERKVGGWMDDKRNEMPFLVHLFFCFCLNYYSNPQTSPTVSIRALSQAPNLTSRGGVL